MSGNIEYWRDRLDQTDRELAKTEHMLATWKARAEKAEAALAEAKAILAAWDINSLPKDYPLPKLAQDRIDDLSKFMARAAKAEAALHAIQRDEEERVFAILKEQGR